MLESTERALQHGYKADRGRPRRTQRTAAVAWLLTGGAGMQWVKGANQPLFLEPVPIPLVAGRPVRPAGVAHIRGVQGCRQGRTGQEIDNFEGGWTKNRQFWQR
eukprot:COSAG01_NODE_3883_length_5588_cov_9.286209_4_plen_104_part_00